MSNLVTADQLVPLIEGMKGTSLEQFQKMLRSGSWPIFIESDFDKIDLSELKRVCKSKIVPNNLEIFELEIVGTVRRHTLISCECSDLDDLILQIANEERFRTPYRSSLYTFVRNFPKSDGDGPICLPIGTVEGFYESICASKREPWVLYQRNSVKEKITRNERWLVEVVDEKSKQPKETEEWKKVVLPKDTKPFRQDISSPSFVVEQNFWLRAGIEIKIGKGITKRSKYRGILTTLSVVPYKANYGDSWRDEGFILEEYIGIQ